MRIEAPGAAGPVAHTDDARPLAVRVAQAGDPARATDAFSLPSPDKIIKLQPSPLGGGLEASAYRLPEGATFDTVKLVTIDGRQVLALVQADGSILVLEGVGPASGSAVPGAADEVALPNLLIGNVEVPREALAAAFQANGIQPAAGGEPIVSSGNNFGDPVPDIGPGGRFGPLLPPTELSQDRLERPDFGGDLGNRNGGLAGVAGGSLSTSLTGSSPLAPSFIAGTFTGTPAGGGSGSGTGGTGVVGGGTTEPGTGTGTGTGTGAGTGSGTAARSGLAIVDQAATDLGTNPASNAEFKTLAIDVSAGTAAATVSFNTASLAGLVSNTNGVGGPDVTWKLVNSNLIAGYVNVPGAGGPEERHVVTVELRGQPGVSTTDPIVIPKDTTSPVYVVVHVIDGIPDAVGNPVDGLDLGKVVLHATSSVGTADGVIAIQVLDDAPKAGFEVLAGGEGGSFFGIVHDETAAQQGTADDKPGAPPALLSGVPGIASPLIGWAEKALGSTIVDTSKIGADHYPTDINGDLAPHYALTNGAGNPFAGTDTLLTATNGGEHIYLYSETVAGQAVLVGREGTTSGADAAGKVAFVLYLDSASNLYLAQYEAIAHPVPGNNNETVSALANLVHLTQTLTDGDGDTASFTSPIGLGVSFTDDGPAPVGIELSGATLVLDESRVATPGDANALVDEPGANPFPAGLGQPIGLVTGAAAGILGTPATVFGTDGPAAKNALVFSLVGADHQAFSTTEGVATGLSVTQTTNPGTSPAILLYAVAGAGNLLVGKTADGTIAFAIRVDPQDGSVSVAQYAAIHHGDPLNPDDTVLLGNGNDLVFVAMTATDGDGDSATVYSATGLHVAFEDDGPRMAEGAKPVVIGVDESGLDTAFSHGNHDGEPVLRDGETAGNDAVTVTGTLSGLVDVGTDTFAVPGAEYTVKLAAVLPDVFSQGAKVGFSVDQLTGTIIGTANGHTVLSMTVATNGSYTFTVFDQIDHPAGDNAEGSLSVDLSGFIVARDADGDALTLPAGSVVLKVQDDIPVLVHDGGPAGGWTVNEHGVEAHDGSAKVTGSLQPLVGVGADEIVFAGKDGGKDVRGAGFSLSLGDGTAETGLTVEGDKVLVRQDGNTLVGFVEGSGTPGQETKAFVFTLDRDGSFSFELLTKLDHAEGQGSSDIDLSAFVRAEDFDHDGIGLAPGTVTFHVGDDVPTTTGSTFVGDVDESALPGGNPDPGMGSASIAGSLKGLVNPGTGSENGHALFSIEPGADGLVLPGITSGHGDVTLHVVGNTQLVGVGDGRDVFRLDLNADGTFTFHLLGPIDHRDENGGSAQDVLPLDLSPYIRVQDTDGDKVALNPGSFVVNVKDDMPVSVPCEEFEVSRSVYEEGLAGGGPDTPTTAGSHDGFGTAPTLLGLFKAGADGALDVGLKAKFNDGDMPRLYSNGVLLTYSLSADAGQLTAKAGSQTIFTLTVAKDGNWSFVLEGHLDHVPGKGDDAELFTDSGYPVTSLDLSRFVIGIDNDSDTIVGATPGSFLIRIVDDVAHFVTAEADAVANKAGSTATGDIVFDTGADVPGTATQFAPLSGTTEQTVDGKTVKTVLSADGKTITGYVDLDASTGTVSPNEKVFTVSLNGDAYTYTQVKAFDGMLQPAASVTGSTAFGSGPSTSQILTSGDGTAIAILTGYVVTTSGNHAFNESAWLAGHGASAGLEQREVNGSTTGWGVNNNNFNAQEFIRVDFHDQDFGAPQGFAGPAVTSASFEFANFSNSGNNADVVKYVAYYEDGTTASGQVPASTVTIGDGSRPLDYIEFYQAAGQTKLDLVGIGKMSMASANAGLEFDVVKSDSDGDKASGTISITVTGDKIQEASNDCDTHLVASSDKNTVLVGHGGDDFLTGGKGDDILIGNLGADTLAGGGGKDTFKLTDIAAHDLITDYKVGEDRIDLTGLFSTAIGGPSSAAQLAEYVSYDKTTGELKVDTDGTGNAAAPVLVAVVESAPSSHPASITIVYDDHSHAHQQANVTG